MTLVTIDLGDVAGGHNPDDHVVIRAEAFRESPGGGITSTAEVIIPLVDGVGEAEVEPGPVVVAFRCKAVADTREKRGVVPDEVTADLGDVIAGDFVYTPAVVSAAVQARNEALAAAGRAEAGADRVGSAEQVGQWASEAQGAAQSTATDREEVAADRQVVAQDKADVLALTTRAESAAGDAETHAELAEEKAGVATDAAGKATLSEQAAAQSASDADLDRVAAEQASTRAEQAEQVATGAATTATNKATEAGLAADRAEQATAGKADLIGGKVPTSQIPEVALTKPFPVSSRQEMLALSAQEGDIAIISTGADKGSYILGSGPSDVFSSWLLMAVSADVPVQSVNGQVGNVNLGASDVGAAPANHTHTPASIGAAPATHQHTMSQVTDLPAFATNAAGGTAAMRNLDGTLAAASPKDATDVATKSYVDQRPALFSGVGPPPANIAGATVGDHWLNETTMELSKITGV